MVPLFRHSIIPFLVLCVAAAALRAGSDSNGKPPAAAIENVTTDYFGTKVVDPYRWIEDGTANPKFLEFLKSQNAYTRSVLDSLRAAMPF